MALIKGYKYTTEVKAKAAVKACNDYYLPNNKKSNVTKNWVMYATKINGVTLFYIEHHHSLNEVLGEPTEFNIII
jgi:hypothetical protein